jgi:hypothetical protein
MAYVGCKIRLLPQERWVEGARIARTINPANGVNLRALQSGVPGTVIPPQHLALLTAKFWWTGGVHLTVSFLDDAEQDLQQRILSHMNAWGQYCDAHFTLVDSGGDVRIARIPDDGYWSYLGTDVKAIPADQPTMNLEGFSMDVPESEYHRVVRHETGHTLGFPHEHMRDQIIARIDRDKAIQYFEATQGWSEQVVIDQVLTPFDNSALIATAQADENSIMCYGLPDQIMTDGVAVPGGLDIDPMDQQFAATMYPPTSSPTPSNGT